MSKKKSIAAAKFIQDMKAWSLRLESEEWCIFDTAIHSWDRLLLEAGDLIGALIDTSEGEKVVIFISSGDRVDDIHYLAVSYGLRKVEFLTPKEAVQRSMLEKLDSYSDNLEAFPSSK